METLRNKRIVFVFDNLELGGAERQGVELALYLRDECFSKVEVWGLSATSGWLTSFCHQMGIPCRGIDFRPVGFLGWLLSLWRFVTAIWRVRPDVLMPYTSSPNVVCGLAWRLTRARSCIWSQRDSGLLFSRVFLHRLAIRLTPCFVVNSTGGGNFLVNQFKVKAEQIHLIHNGIALPVPTMDRQVWRIRLEATEGQLIVCMVANFSEYKDHSTLIRAWKLVLAKDNQLEQEPLLVLAGRDDGVLNQLRVLVEEMNLARFVRFLGFIEDISGLLSASDIFAYSSPSEGLPNGVLEAMYSGLPVVGTDIPGIREAVGPDGVEYLAPVGDSGVMARLLLRLIVDHNGRQSLGRTLQRRVQESFAMGKMCRNSASLIVSQLDNR